MSCWLTPHLSEALVISSRHGEASQPRPLRSSPAAGKSLQLTSLANVLAPRPCAVQKATGLAPPPEAKAAHHASPLDPGSFPPTPASVPGALTYFQLPRQAGVRVRCRATGTDTSEACQSYCAQESAVARPPVLL